MLMGLMEEEEEGNLLEQERGVSLCTCRKAFSSSDGRQGRDLAQARVVG